jgi:hypothetical protein
VELVGSADFAGTTQPGTTQQAVQMADPVRGTAGISGTASGRKVPGQDNPENNAELGNDPSKRESSERALSCIALLVTPGH